MVFLFVPEQTFVYLDHNTIPAELNRIICAHLTKKCAQAINYFHNDLPVKVHLYHDLHLSMVIKSFTTHPNDIAQGCTEFTKKCLGMD
ncbi:hypothetical protein ECANGB1_500 [Enterospora canceri]|uniref:Uncharacterized protein n=1 Tax=Enterospora canceri TaxID=1081671 RepID=A0A1Y1S537_9MICR|nr:hypothetical protein ECANGB1_500 [Enterospora canceri]